MNKKPQLNFLCWFRRGRSEVSFSKSLDLIDTWLIVILPDKVLLLCSDDVLPRVVTAFVPANVLGGLVLVGTGWTKQIPWQVAVKET